MRDEWLELIFLIMIMGGILYAVYQFAVSILYLMQ